MAVVFCPSSGWMGTDEDVEDISIAAKDGSGLAENDVDTDDDAREEVEEDTADDTVTAEVEEKDAAPT